MQGLNPFSRMQGEGGRPAPVRHVPSRPAPVQQRVQRRDPAPSRLAYRLNRMMLRPFMRRMRGQLRPTSWTGHLALCQPQQDFGQRFKPKMAFGMFCLDLGKDFRQPILRLGAGDQQREQAAFFVLEMQGQGASDMLAHPSRHFGIGSIAGGQRIQRRANLRLHQMRGLQQFDTVRHYAACKVTPETSAPAINPST